MRGKNDEFYLVLAMKIQKKMEKYLKKVLTNHFSCAILFKRSRKTALEMPKCRCGGLGRRPGLKIPWENIPYRFDPGHRHQFHIAEWSNPVARRAHNPKVVGSNPASATKKNKHPIGCLFLFGCRLCRAGFEPTAYGERSTAACGKSGE